MAAGVAGAAAAPTSMAALANIKDYFVTKKRVQAAKSGTIYGRDLQTGDILFTGRARGNYPPLMSINKLETGAKIGSGPSLRHGMVRISSYTIDPGNFSPQILGRIKDSEEILGEDPISQMIAKKYFIKDKLKKLSRGKTLKPTDIQRIKKHYSTVWDKQIELIRSRLKDRRGPSNRELRTMGYVAKQNLPIDTGTLSMVVIKPTKPLTRQEKLKTAKFIRKNVNAFYSINNAVAGGVKSVFLPNFMRRGRPGKINMQGIAYHCGSLPATAAAITGRGPNKNPAQMMPGEMFRSTDYKIHKVYNKPEVLREVASNFRKKLGVQLGAIGAIGTAGYYLTKKMREK